MAIDRRSLLSMSGAALALGNGGAARAAAAAQAATRGSGGEHPRNITYATIQSSTGELGLGLRTQRGVVDVMAYDRALQAGLPLTLEDVINKRGDLDALAKLATATVPARYVIAETAVKFGPVVGSAPKIFCVGLNYRAHVAEGSAEVPKEPILFNKFDSSLNSHNGVIAVSKQKGSHWDYEAELVMIIGKGGSNIAKERALDHVFGYCNGNDFTERARQFVSAQWMLGKAGDGWGPLGPWLVSGDQIDPTNLDLKCIVNGEVRQSSNTSLMIFDCRALVSYISENWELRPGDVVFTGTCEGVIAGYPPDKQVWLKPGDRISTEISKLGRLDFTLV
jgi:2-keto-4-pentenoate hydratase/2-oxohepta-3-ene-1,7-dioic acid hydratase in catechol pathway